MGGKNYQALIIVLCCILASCKKDKPNAPAGFTFTGAGSVFVVCEGNFGSGNSSLYAYKPARDSIFGDLYSNANKQSLGDVFQSMVKINSQYFLCINNSDRVVILNAGTLTVAGVINIPKPRYILPISDNKAYVSSQYSQNVYVINPQTHKVLDTVELPHMNPEGMCLFNNTAVICTWDIVCNVIYKVDIGTDKVVHVLGLAGYAPQEALLDNEGMLWVLSGNKPQHRVSTLTRLNPSSGDMLASYRFPDNADAIKPVFNNTRDTLYFIEANFDGGTANNGVYRMGIHESTLPATPFVAGKAFQYFWGLGIEPSTGYVYIGDPKGFTQKGSVYIYRQDGTQIKSFDVGMGPGHFYFER